jgi:acylphosphatase
MSEIAARRLLVEGRVQGVGYRDAMVEAACAVRVRGHVRNRPDGTVEAHVQGDPEALAAIIAWASRGPPAARVARVVVEHAEVDGAHAAFRRTF